ncbi:MAG TPA: large-conductance mechanosensitive channel protein MscL [Burkholderiales bacterium]|nr:large-conductance mechanosensitive channel protein MscL [Burkholderiales bacterium]
MSILKEFRDFAVKGNVVDLAVAVIIGTAFGKIVSSLVADIIMPVLGALIAGLNFKDLAIQIGSAKIAYGLFIQACVDFLIIAWAIFIAVKLINRFRRKEEPAAAPPPAPPAELKVLEEIRDLLKSQRA